MAGFENNVMVSKNMNFDTQAVKPHLGVIDAAGKFPIGSGSLFPIAEILGGTITSPLGTLTIGYSSPNITIDLVGGGAAIDSIAVDTTTGAGTNPVVPTAAGLVTLTGGQYATGSFGTRVLTINSSAANTIQVLVQESSAVAASDSTKNGIAHFDSARFTVNASGFVSLSTTGALETLTGDTGTATPVAGNIQIAGGPGITTSATGAIVTINSVVFTNTAAATLTVDSGFFCTAAGTYPMPATATQGELIIVVADTAGAVVLDVPALNFIRVGNQITAASGTATSTAIGDSLTLRYRLSSLTWEATAVIGTWLIV